MNIILLIALICASFTGITSGYTVTGNKLNDPNGNQVLIRGVDRPSFEWNVVGEHASLADYTLMKEGWGANVVRVSLNQDFWFNTPAYATTIDQQVTWITSLGMGVILDLHWNNGGQQNMADRKSISFWSAVAARYKNQPWVMFELYNEPHDVSWSQWLHGDATYAGMQELYAAVRGAGAENVVIVCGLNWAFDLSGVGTGYAVQGTNIAYASHPYDYAGKQINDWSAAFGFLASTHPVILTEFGQYCSTGSYVSDLLSYAQSNGIHWTAWAWYVSGCAFPSIIQDWNGVPVPGVGELIKSYISGPKSRVVPAPIASSPSAPSSTDGNVVSVLPSVPPTPPMAAPLIVYAGGLQNGWQDWSWSTSYSLSDTQYLRTGSKSVKFEVVGYEGVYFHATTAPLVSGAYTSLQFYVNGGTSDKLAGAISVKLYGTSASVIGNSVNLPTAPTTNAWNLITIPIPSFGVSANTLMTGFVIQSNEGSSAGFVWIDDISFTAQPSL